ncbi:MAG: 23S rRNA (guanosine(2251)-2'-O)-methyltransferase RlmB [Anaerovoracaceae bacterium]|nr:23S rRNA (guanosine(2251)-2'-O)-methyltransferase RlmB [Anaerovoracaceae bacterium]
MKEYNVIFGRNPVIEALRSGRQIEKILVSSSEGSVRQIAAMAKEKSIPVIKTERKALDRLSGGVSHQGVAAFTGAYGYASWQDVLDRAESSGEEPFVIILDGIEDPHNLGAIMRTAECAGAHGIILPKRNSCGLTETVAKTSAGAVEYMPCVRVTNIGRTVEELKEQGFWTAACDMGGQEYYKADLTGRLAVVIGGEGHGISRLVREKCDFVVSMPMKGRITSLNASNAAAVIMYEVRRQRDGKR